MEVMKRGRKKTPLADRLLRLTIPEPNSGCLLWTASVRGEDGYGVVKVNGKTESTHRVSYRVFKGEVPEGFLVMHKCDTPCCVNPDHLVLGTPKDNSRDMVRKNRNFAPSGEDHANAKLSLEDVKKIRSIEGLTYKDIGKMFNVSKSQVSMIRSYKKWKHVE